MNLAMRNRESRSRCALTYCSYFRVNVVAAGPKTRPSPKMLALTETIQRIASKVTGPTRSLAWRRRCFLWPRTLL